MLKIMRLHSLGIPMIFLILVSVRVSFTNSGDHLKTKIETIIERIPKKRKEIRHPHTVPSANAIIGANM